jgi:hypothetical protein
MFQRNTLPPSSGLHETLGLHGIATQNTTIDIFTTVRTSNRIQTRIHLPYHPRTAEQRLLWRLRTWRRDIDGIIRKPDFLQRTSVYSCRKFWRREVNGFIIQKDQFETQCSFWSLRTPFRYTLCTERNGYSEQFHVFQAFTDFRL